MGQPWGRLYTGTRNHRKVAAIRRKHKDIWSYLYVLMECSFEADDDGKIYINPDLPYSIEELVDEIHFHKSPKFLRDLIETAVKVGLFSYENQIPQWLSYSERQFKSDHNTAERVRKYRENRKGSEWQKQYCNVTETLPCNEPETAKIQIQIQKQNNTPPTPPGGGNGIDVDFEKFWETYPNTKGGKKAAFMRWKKAKQAKELPPIAFILQSIELLKNSEAWQKDSGQFIPMATTFLNQGRWTDADKLRASPIKPRADCPKCHGKGMYPRGDGKGQVVCDCRKEST